MADMARETLKEKTAKGLFWGGVSNGVQQLLNLVFGIFLARMLSQDDYGMVGMLLIFSNVAASIQEGGFISALNRRKEVSAKDYNAVFWLCSSVSVVIYLILFFSAPLIARFYGEPELTSLARFLFIGFVISSLGIAPGAYVFRNMMVRETAIIMFVSQLVSGLAAIVMVLMGGGYWSIAVQTLVYVSFVALLRYYFSGFRPSLHVDLRPVKEMFTFGSKLMITNVFTAINNNLISVILGRYYTPRDVGNYTQANKWNTMGWSLISNMLHSIAQPVLARTDDDVERQKRIFRKLLRFTAFVSFPAMLGLALVSEEFIVILLTDRWLESAQMMQVLCVAGAVMPISTLFSNLLISRGRSSVYMWCMLAQCVVQLVAAAVAVPWGIRYMVMAYVATNILWVAVWFCLARRGIALRIVEALSDVTPYMVLSIVSIILAYIVSRDIANIYLSITVKVVVAAAAYCFALWLLRSAIFKEVILFVTKKEVK